MLALSLAEIKPVYYPGETKLVSLDVLKLYRGEDVVRQNPEDIDPDRYTDDGELTELSEMPGREPERVHLETGLEVHVPEAELEQEIEMDLQDTPESIAEREDIHERIQSELRNEDKEEVSWAEKMLELPPG